MVWSAGIFYWKLPCLCPLHPTNFGFPTDGQTNNTTGTVNHEQREHGADNSVHGKTCFEKVGTA